MKTGSMSLTRGIAVVSLLCSTVVVNSAFAQRLPPAQTTALAEVSGQGTAIRDVSLQLWGQAETALAEYASARLLADILEGEGFTVTRGVADMPTAFIASYGSGHPVIGILAEYDALPGVGNGAVPRREPLAGNTNGHGCGHNLFGAGSVAAAIAVKRTMQKHGLRGTIRLYGTPAEETVVGKVYMAKAGVFDDLDASLDWHAGQETRISNQIGQAMNNFEVEFFGQPAHAASDPWNGQSALDAVEMMNFGVNLMREHIRPTARIHYVISKGGEAPNVVPAYARVWYYARDVERSSVDAHYKKIIDIAKGAALATGTTFKINLLTGVHEKLLNRPLQEIMQKNLLFVGTPDFTAEDHAFAKELQRSLGVEEKGLNTKVRLLTPGPEPLEGGSTDLAEVSWIAPAATVYVTTAADGIPWHSWAATASHGTMGAVRGAEVAAKVLALTAIDLMTDPQLLKKAQAYFMEKSGGKVYKSPLPAGQKPALPGAGR